jgi:serine protease Do
MKKDIIKIVCFFAVGMAGGIFSDQVFWPYFVEKPIFSEYGLEQSPTIEVREFIIQESTALEKSIEKVEDAIVGIKSQRQGKTAEGSGLIVTSDGFVVTLSELILDYSTSTMHIDGNSFPLRLLKRDSENNLALLKVEENSLPTVGFGDLDKVDLGERVFLLGTVFDKSAHSVEKIANEGIVRRVGDGDIGTNILEDKNMKGSALFNIVGEVLGINTIFDGKVITIPVSRIKELIGM